MSDDDPLVHVSEHLRMLAGLRDYFRHKRDELLARSKQTVARHSGLRGNLREHVVKSYLSEIVPRRFSIGKGQIIAPVHHSQEMDVVIWDDYSYPRIPQAELENVFFAESVRATVEVKSVWEWGELTDILKKAKSVRDIICHNGPSHDDVLDWVICRIRSLEAGEPAREVLSVRHHIGTAAFIARGGHQFCLSDSRMPEIESIDDQWPDVMVFLEPGLIVTKEYASGDSPMAGRGALLLYAAGDDSLALFTDAMLRRLAERSSHPESPLELRRYLALGGALSDEPQDVLEFPLARPCPGLHLL